MVRLAVDVGGTFTDLVAYDQANGRITIAKALTTSHDQSEGVLDCISKATVEGGLRPASVDFYVHGGTTVINAITERTGVKTALLTTKGFRDVLEIGRGNRPDLYNLQARSPEPYVPRRYRFEITERLDARGEIVEPLDENDIRKAAEQCRQAGIEAIAVIFLHSYINPSHEERCATLLQQLLPDVAVSASHSVSRQWREYERSNTTALNAYVLPIIRRYFANLSQSLKAIGVNCDYYAMQSNGTVATFAQATDQPLTLVESGPSGGVAGAVRIGAEIGDEDILYFDVGGTTAKCSLVRGGKPQLTAAYRMGRTRLSPGYPVQVPVIDIVEIGAGGGSIAWLDEIGRLRVGPKSAGSDPGPACYKNGGTLPTLTDAKLVIGILDAQNFASGQIELSLKAAREAFRLLADRLAMRIEAAASAVVRIAEASMIDALKLVTVERGHDPRDLAFVVSGGAGPMLAAKLGRELHVKSTIIPVYPGIFSAWGMLAAFPGLDLRRTYFGRATSTVLGEIRDVCKLLLSEAVTHFGVGGDDGLSLSYRLEARYKGQEHSVATDFDLAWPIEKFLAAFHQAHKTAYTFEMPSTPVEITNIHLRAEMISEVVDLTTICRNNRGGVGAVWKPKRDVYIDDTTGWVACRVADRAELPVGEKIDGPLLIEEATTTSLVLPGQSMMVNDTGLIIIKENR